MDSLDLSSVYIDVHMVLEFSRIVMAKVKCFILGCKVPSRKENWFCTSLWTMPVCDNNTNKYNTKEIGGLVKGKL